MSSTPMINVTLIEPQTPIRQAIRLLLSSATDIEVIAEHAHVQDCKKDRLLSPPDIVIVGEKGNGIATALNRSPHTKMILLLESEKSCCPSRLLSLNLAGYLFKKDVTETLVHIIRAVAHGQTAWYSQSVVTHLAHRLKDAATLQAQIQAFDVSLTEREWSVLELIVRGSTNDEIGRMLCLSPQTVRNQASKIYKKFGVHSRLELIRLFQNE
ncbi:MAG: response regulator transcription factor [Chloroflexota bacterium]